MILNLKDLRAAAGLRQEDVAKRLNVDQSAVAKWECGCNAPLGKYRGMLAVAYGVTPEQLNESIKLTMGGE